MGMGKASVFGFASIFVFFLAVWPAFADTVVGGSITGNTVWDSSGNPYIVSSSVTVEEGASLTISSGTELRFAPGTSLEVKGLLYVAGTEDEPVRMVADGDGTWNGIIFSSVAANGSYIEHAEVSGASTGISVLETSVRISHCRIENNTTNGIYLRNSGSTVEGCLISHNRYGIYLTGGSPAVIRNNWIGNNSDTGFIIILLLRLILLLIL